MGRIFLDEFLHLFHEIAAVDRVRGTLEENFLLMHAGSVVNFLPSGGNAIPLPVASPRKGPLSRVLRLVAYNNTATHLNPPLEYYELKDN